MWNTAETLTVKISESIRFASMFVISRQTNDEQMLLVLVQYFPTVAEKSCRLQVKY